MEVPSAATAGAELLFDALASYQADRLFEAVAKLNDLDNLLKKDDPSLSDLRKKVATEARCSQMRAEYAEAVRVTNEMKSDEGWSLVKDSGTIKTFYRQKLGTPIHSVRMIADLDAPLLHLLVLIAEADLYKVWVPFMEESREVIGTGYRKIVYIKVGLPWPFEARDSCCYGYTVDRLAEEGSILLVMRDPVASDPLQLPAPMPVKEKTVRMTFHLGGLMLRPLGEKTRMYLIGSVDPQLMYIPYWLINMCTTSLAPTAISMFGSKAKNIDSTPHAERLHLTKKTFYDDVRQRLEEGIRRGADARHHSPQHYKEHKSEYHSHKDSSGEKDSKKRDDETKSSDRREQEKQKQQSSDAARHTSEKERAAARSLQLDIDS